MRKDRRQMTSVGDFVAYHSTAVMGYEFEPGPTFHFFSGKSQSFLQRALGGRVWTVTGTRDNCKRMVYRLAGMFIPSRILRASGGFSIVGKGTPVHPGIELGFYDWFPLLLREQNRFSFGFNAIRDQSVVDGLEKLLEQHTR